MNAEVPGTTEMSGACSSRRKAHRVAQEVLRRAIEDDLLSPVNERNPAGGERARL